MHTPTGSYISDGVKCEFVKSGHELVENLDVTGAGDTFAGALINALLEGKNIKLAVSEAHKSTCGFLTTFQQ